MPAPRVGQRIKESRERAGLSRPVLAGLIGMSAEWLKRVENGRIQTPRLEHVETAHKRWLQMDEPCWERFGLTVTPGRHRLWVDSSAHVVAELS